MLNILIIIGWLFAICLMLYLAKELVKDRFHKRRERKLAIRNAIRARRREQFMENRRRWAEINTGVIQPRPAEAAANVERRQKQNQRLFGWMVLLLWQGYWMVEIVDQFKKSDTRSNCRTSFCLSSWSSSLIPFIGSRAGGSDSRGGHRTGIAIG